MGCFWRHTWGKWKDKKRMDIYIEIDKTGKHLIGEVFYQERICSVYGYTEVDRTTMRSD